MKNVNPLEKKNLNHSPPPYLYPSQHSPDVCISFQFPLLKETNNAHLCTGKIETIPSNNIENKP